MGTPGQGTPRAGTPGQGTPRRGSDPRVLGAVVDDQTRCIHYHSPLDVIAIKFFCCREYYPCHLCHDESAAHPAQVWPVGQQGEPAVLCGVCSGELSVTEYLGVDGCPRCGAAFNPGCRLHSHLYFEPANTQR